MLLLQTKGNITTANDKTNLYHRFDVPPGIKRLTIHYSYTPKTLDDREQAIALVRACYEKYGETLFGRAADCLPVKNLITLSVDDNGTYRGAAHRQANEQTHTLAADFASPGFLPGAIHAGEWALVLNVHSVSCDVTYQITVEGEEEA